MPSKGRKAGWKSYMLVYEQDGDVFAILREALKGVFDGSVFRLLVDDKEVLLGIWRSGDVLFGRRWISRRWWEQRM